jgi:hypothetical protein
MRLNIGMGLETADAMRWLEPADVAAATGVRVGVAHPVETPDTYGARFDGEDARGRYHFEVHSLRGGNPAEWIDTQAEHFARRRALPDFADYARAGSDTDDDDACFARCADACFAAYAHGPGVATTRAAERLLRRLFDWPE